MAFEASRITRSAVRVSGFRDPEFDYQLVRTMGLADYGGATVGECLAAAAMIAEGDTSGWAQVFAALADRVEAAADASLAAGHPVSARDHLLRASTYHHTAEYYAEADPVSLTERGERSRACFERALALGPPGVEAVSIPFGGTELPGYLVQPVHRETEGPRGTLVVVGGFDSSAEELYFQLGAPGAERGWQVLVFDGPGQSGCLRRHAALTFRPDYEVPLAAVGDFVAGRPDTRPDRLALAGLSFGGYFAARAAARDERVRALVAVPPVVDLYRYMEAWLGEPVFRSRQDIRLEDVTGVPEDLLLPQMVWGMAAVCRRFGVSSLFEFLEFLDAFRLGDLVDDISCPVLAVLGAREGDEVVRQAEVLAEHVRGATVRRFGTDDGADAHALVSNLRLLAQVAYDWLDETLVP
jgi:pimeloyl-ACP methyl ester carboxylesterase